MDLRIVEYFGDEIYRGVSQKRRRRLGSNNRRWKRLMKTPETAAKERKGAGTKLRKYQPDCRLPNSAVMRKLTASESQRLRMRTVEMIECVFSPEFTRAGAEQRFVPDFDDGDAGSERHIGVCWKNDKPKRALTRVEERDLFMRFNYCRYRMMRILKSHAGRCMNSEAARDLLRWDRAALDARDDIVRANLGLAPSMVERSRLTGVDFAELISEGQMALLRSIDKFDCTRGFKFSTYACRAIMTSISRARALAARHHARFPATYDPNLQSDDLRESRRDEIEATCILEFRGIWKENTAKLSNTERRILSERFGINNAGKKRGDPKTLRQVAEVFGVTKERVRQIQNRALARLRSVLDEQAFAIA